VEEDPGGTTVGKGADIAHKEKCDGIIVVGGGSPICAGRGIGVLVTTREHKDYAGLNRLETPLPLIAIPTTAGSGAEVSQFILLKVRNFTQRWVVGSPMYFPKVPFSIRCCSGDCPMAGGRQRHRMRSAMPSRPTVQPDDSVHGFVGPSSDRDDLSQSQACCDSDASGCKGSLPYRKRNGQYGLAETPNLGRLEPQRAMTQMPTAQRIFNSQPIHARFLQRQPESCARRLSCSTGRVRLRDLRIEGARGRPCRHRECN